MKSSTAFIFILIAAGLFYTFIMPEYAKVQALQAEAAQYKDVLGNVSDLSQKRDALLLKYNAIPQADIDNLQKILPDNVNVVELALDLDAIAGKYGISIKKVETVNEQDQNATSIQAPAPSGPYHKAVIALSFVSTYDSFRKFESDLEKSLRIINVKSVSFTTADSGLDEFQMDLEVYYLGAASSTPSTTAQ